MRIVIPTAQVSGRALTGALGRRFRATPPDPSDACRHREPGDAVRWLAAPTESSSGAVPRRVWCFAHRSSLGSALHLTATLAFTPIGSPAIHTKPIAEYEVVRSGGLANALRPNLELPAALTRLNQLPWRSGRRAR